jgi:hypothetical protein
MERSKYMICPNPHLYYSRSLKGLWLLVNPSKPFSDREEGTDDSSNISCYAAWSPSGNGFAVPTRTNGISPWTVDVEGADARNRYYQ